jgi:outer membrane protein OmpA-like peptidoglycan-associated protein
MKHISIIIVLITLVSTHGHGQIRVDNSDSIAYYVRNVLIGSGIEVNNIKHTGMSGSVGQFEANKSIIGVSGGLVISTGNADSIVGPNNSGRYTSKGEYPQTANGVRAMKKGDKDLKKIGRSSVNDMTIIEFDFIPINNKLEFNYVFASEEYIEYVGTGYNDVFGFFLSGPGIKKKVNLAILPNTRTPITINTINHIKNKKYFRRNTIPSGKLKKLLTPKKVMQSYQQLHDKLQFDGLTTVLKVQYDVIPYKVYHIKIAIADIGDHSYDSAVFLEGNSFSSVRDSTGKYFKIAMEAEKKPLNIDSIFHPQALIADSVVAEIDDKFEITDIYFDRDSHELSKASQSQLENLAQYLKNHPDLRCTIYGYTDNIGSFKYNQELSEKRALSVIDFLAESGIDRSALEYLGNSFSNPKADNETETGRAMNRRVEIVLE